MSGHRDRSERGAMAVFVAFTALVLFAVGAMAVDLGNAYARKRDVQSQADFAALAAASDIPNTSFTPAATDPAVITAKNYLNDNQPQDDKGITAVTAAQLVNGNLADGEVKYGIWDATTDRWILAKDKLTVVAPQAQVDFGLAGVLKMFSSSSPRRAQVSSRASVTVVSPAGTASMPVYSATGCDYGQQAITQPTNGQAAGLSLQYPTDTNDASLTALNPSQVALNASGQSLVISGVNFTETVGKPATAHDLTQVGFFEAGNPAPAPVVVTATPTSATSATVTIPTSVTGIQDVWFVRVYQWNSSDNKYEWSDVDGAEPLQVGDAVLTCEQGSNDGNFGTISVPRGDGSTDNTTNGWLPLNVAKGLDAQNGVSLAVFPTPPTPVPAECNAGTQNAIMSDKNNLRLYTNCVLTDPGFPANSATNGLITGVGGSVPGRLDKDTSTACNGTGARTHAFGSYWINNDTLTCFFRDSSTMLGTITNRSYAGPPVLTSDIYSSPRFFWTPVLKQVPDSGRKSWSIVDFRPAFITDQGNFATKSTAASATNGLTYKGSSVESVQVVFFNPKALPADPGGAPVGPYMGAGPKIPQLID